MDNVLSEIKSIPGIIGGFFYDSIQGVKGSNLSAIFKEENLNKIGKVLDKMYEMSESGVTDISELFLFYEESTLCLRKIGKTSSLIIISDPSLNQNLLLMSLNMHAEELKKISLKFNDVNENEEQIATDASPALEKISEEDVINNSSVAAELQEMQTALLKVIGPIAKILFKDAVRDLIQLQDPSKAPLPGLLKILINEINDPEKVQNYEEMVARFIADDKG